jgi:hypothetical protein
LAGQGRLIDAHLPRPQPDIGRDHRAPSASARYPSATGSRAGATRSETGVVPGPCKAASRTASHQVDSCLQRSKMGASPLRTGPCGVGQQRARLCRHGHTGHDCNRQTDLNQRRTYAFAA